MKRINLEDIKVAIFDFDDTLAIHKDSNFLKHHNESEEKLWDYYMNAYLNSKSFYETIEPCFLSDSLYKLINILRKNNVKMYCLSGMKFSFNFKAKEQFVHKFYGSDIEMISTQTQESKVDAVKIIQRINNCNLNEIIFVDDLKENVIRLNEIGTYAILPCEVDLLINGEI